MKEEFLIESLATTIDVLPLPTIIYQPENNKIQLCNQSASELLDDGLSDYFEQELPVLFTKINQNSQLSEGTHTVNFNRKPPFTHIYIKYKCISDHLFCLQFTPITSQSCVQEEKQLLESNIKSIIESTQDIIFSLDNNFCYTEFNRNHYLTMKKIYGKDIEIGENILSYMRVNGDHIKAQTDIQRSLDGEQYSVVQVYGDQKYERTYFEASYNPIYNNGEIVGCSVFVKDISDNIHTQEKLQELNDSLSKQNEQLRKYQFINSHQVRAKLSSIIGLVQIMLEDQPEDENVNLLFQSAQGLDDHIHELNDLLNKERKPFQFKDLHMNALTNIWMIDDDALHHKISTKMVELYNPELSITSFFSAKEALKQLHDRAELPDLIVLDLNMPGMNGWEFLVHYEQLAFAIPIHILTSSIDFEDKIRSTNFACVKGFTSKPLNMDNLQEILAINAEESLTNIIP
ncbi:response regulator [Persicobacter psychrovividus]|uniref:Response regulatory domain-containing protein n=1 Tax=Persicobacter psychrovividus TaxID=387638 RepID=A0ABM7VE44_9BACT|nr:hypothetical protein PEPS_14760 [Persicobacter psychrovividus]